MEKDNFKEIFNYAPGIIFVIDLKGDLVFSNHLFDKLPQRAGESTPSQEILVSLSRQVLLSRRVSKIETQNLYGEAVPFFGDQGQLTHVIANCFELPGKRKAEATPAKVSGYEHHRCVSLLQATLDSTTDGILVFNNEGVVTVYNKKLLELWNIPEGYLDCHNYNEVFKLVHDQLQQPATCEIKIKELMANPALESNDIIELKSGKIFERYSRPQCSGSQILGRIFSYRDVTERIQYEKNLQENERRHFNFLEKLPVGVFVTDATGQPFYTNQKARRLVSRHDKLGVPLHELGLAVSAYIDGTEQHYPNDRLPLIRALNGERNVMVDDLEVRLEGSSICLQMWADPVFKDDNSLEYVIVAAEDITQQKNHKKQLEHTISLLRGTLDSTADGILVVNREGAIVSFNQKFLDIWEVPEEVIEARSDEETLAFVAGQLKDPTAFLKKVRELYASPELESYDTVEFRSGKILERYSQPQKIKEEIVGRVWSFQDVTNRKKGEEKILNYASQMRALADASRSYNEARLDLSAILQATAQQAADYFQDGCIVRLFSEDKSKLSTVAFHHVNTAALDALSRYVVNITSIIDVVGTNELLQTGKPIVIAANPEQARVRVSPEHRFLLDRFPVHSWVIVALRVANQILGTVAVFRYREGPSYTTEEQTFLQELADRAALSIENSQLYRDAQRAIQLREDFMAIASHELKTPLTPLKMQLGLLSHLVQTGVAMPGPYGEKLKNIITDSDRQITRLTRLVEDLLDATRLQTGRFDLIREPVNLEMLIKNIVRQLQSQLAAAKCSVNFQAERVDEGLWDRGRIEQVVSNLLANAIKYGRSSSVIEIKLTQKNNLAIVSIQDFGIGIAKADQKRIFDRFERAVPVNHYGGVGLGLFIVRQIVEAHGGKIWVESTPGEGSTFTFELPYTKHPAG